MTTNRTLLAAFLAACIAVTAASVAIAQGMQGDMGSGMTQGGMGSDMTQGGMGPGMMQGGMGPGMMGSGMMCPRMMQGGMGSGMMGPGMGRGMMGGMMGAGMMQGGGGPGMHTLFGSRVTPMLNLSAEDVRSYLSLRLERLKNKRLKVGEVKVEDGTVIADIVTVDNSLVQRLKVDRRTGSVEYPE